MKIIDANVTEAGYGVSMTTPSPVPACSPELIAALRADLQAAQWTVSAVNVMLSEVALGALSRDQRVPALVELSSITAGEKPFPRALLTRLFMLGSEETRADLEYAFPTLGVEGALELGIIAEVGAASFTAAFDLRPHEASLPTLASFSADGDPDERADHHWWVMSDLGEVTTGKPLHQDHVLGIGGATMNLLSLTMRQPVKRALDIGTGCGIQALYLATHCEQVVATDISERAAQITLFNAELNNVNIDVRVGSLFEPVEGEKFDLIVSNPPFVITPDSLRGEGLLEYRDGGMQRDTLIGEIIRSAPAHLNDDGVVQMLGNWEIPADVDPEECWHGRVDAWLEGLPVDAWVLQRDLLDPAQYVEMWMRDSGGTLVPREEVERTYAAWIGDFTEAGVGAIGMGSLAMRATTGETRRCYSYIPAGNAPTGADVTLALDNLALPEDIWSETLKYRADVTEERHFVPGAGNPSALILHQGGGMGRAIRVGSNTSAFIGACDGDLTAEQIIGAIAYITEQDVEIVKEEVASLLPDLLRAGILTRRKNG